MSGQQAYWMKKQVSRRTALRAAGVAGGGLAALSLVGCGGSDKKPASSSPAPSEAIPDSTKGKYGGTLQVQSASAPPNLLVLGSGGGGQYRQLVYSGMLQFKFGRPGTPGDALELQPDLAQALPEQPDGVTYVMKLRPGLKFTNGRPVTSEDVAYSYNRVATWDQAPRRPFWFWFDKVETPDPQTVVVKAKAPYGDGLPSLAAYIDAFIVAKEFEESPAASTSAMGTGPYQFVSYEAPVVMNFKRNPDYYDKPYPYFDEVKAYPAADAVKRVTDFTTRQVQYTWWQAEEPRDQMKRDRPDARFWGYPAAGWAVWIRTDQKPLNDKRVRQALNMTIDRKAVREAVSKGEGEDDQALSITNRAFGFRRPKDLGSAAKYWEYNPAEAKKLFAAAGVDKPFETNWSHFDASVDGQTAIDMATLTEARWRELGLANVKDVIQPSAQFNTTTALGNYEGFAHRPGLQGVTPGTTLRTLYWSPPEGVKPPTSNTGYVNNPQLNQLLDKEITQLNFEERKQTVRQVEDIVAEEQYRLAFSTYANTWFADPSIKNIVAPFWAVTGQSAHFKYWWFEK